MPAVSSFDYAIVRVVPHVEREEFINVGVILFCRTRRCLLTRLELDVDRLTALAPDFDVAQVQAHLDLIPRICAGGPEAGPFAGLSQAERFHWLVSPRSTVIQISPVHCGLCTNPKAALNDLFERLVRSSPATGRLLLSKEIKPAGVK
ncbi:MAG: DUF3037 domain-containing protein [Chloroflexota bacterium]